MQITIIHGDNAVGIDQEFRTVDLSALDPAIRVIQFNAATEEGHIEFNAAEGGIPANEAIVSITPYQWVIDAWNALTPAPPAPPTFAEMKASRLDGINRSCEAEIAAISAGYPPSEVMSWSKQESEARAFITEAGAATPLLDNLAAARGITKADLTARIIQKADIFAQVSGRIIGTRQKLEDALNALPAEATIETHGAEFAAIQWPE